MVAGSDSTSNEVSQTPESAQHESYRLTVLGADTKALACTSIQLSGRHFLVRLIFSNIERCLCSDDWE
jgi:hypothetical protein